MGFSIISFTIEFETLSGLSLIIASLLKTSWVKVMQFLVRKANGIMLFFDGFYVDIELIKPEC